MIGNVELYQLTLLAEASYADLWDKSLNLPYTTDNDVQKRLLALGTPIEREQAKLLTDHWSIASHQQNTSSGFSATLFNSKDDPSKYVLAIRGTEPTSFYKDWLVTDFEDLCRDGLAMAQIIDLYNYWQQLKAPKNQSYTVATLETLGLETTYYALAQAGEYIPALAMSASAYIAHLRSRPDIVIDEPLGLIRRIDRTHMSTDIYTDERRYGLDIDPASVTVVGHSLGGHLAAAFSRLFPEVTTDVLMVNGAGFGDEFAIGALGNGPSNIEHLFKQLGGEDSFDADKIVNLVGSAGIDFTAQDSWLGLNQPGLKQPVQTESWGLFSTALGHGASQMTDSMAVYDLFFRLDQTLAGLDPKAAMDFLAPIFKAGSANDSFTLESLVNSLGHLFIGTGFTALKSGTSSRDDMYSRIKQIIGVLPTSGTSLLSIAEASSGSLENLAKVTDSRGIACRYALQQLNPFVVVGADYSRFNQTGELNRIDPNTGAGSLSDAWISDRSAMLTWVMKANTERSSSNPDNLVFMTDQISGYGWDFVDRITGKRILVSSPGLSPSTINHKVIFGKESADSIEGGALSDRLYGCGGNNLLEGGVAFADGYELAIEGRVTVCSH